jgi:hypothetical protein
MTSDAAQWVMAVGTCVAAVASLVSARVSRRVHRQVQTGNGKTIGQMTADAEMHHHRDDAA